MEVFKVFATMSLMDAISGPLKQVQEAMTRVGGSTATLTAQMGQLAIGMGPIALAVAGLLAVLLACTSAAIDFEDSMADVGKVVNFETKDELAAMSDTILEMSGRIPMAADGLAAIIASAAQSGVAKNDLAGFAEQAAKMGVAFDLTGDVAGKMMADWRAGMGLALPQVYALADAVNHLSNNMNASAPALGEVMQRVGALAMSCGLAETEVASLGAAFLSAGASPEIASTALKKFTSTLVKGEAMSKRAQGAFTELGFSVTQMAKDMQTDAQGTIFKVLQALADKPKELQISLLTEMFGEEAIGAIAPLLTNMGNLTQAFELVGDSSFYAGSMEEEFQVRSKTTSNATQLLKNRITGLMITVGSMFTPVIKIAANVLGMVVDALTAFAHTAVGDFLLKLVAAVSAGVLALTLFGGAIFLLQLAVPAVLAALGAAATALAALAWPILIIAAVVGALYLAFKYNLGGITDFVLGWYNKIKLVVSGVIAVFKSLNGGVGELRGDLAKEIKAQGLLGVVTTIAKAFYRVKQLVKGFWDALSPVFSKIGGILDRVFGSLGGALGRLAKAFGKLFVATNPIVKMFSKLFGLGVESSAKGWESFGNILGNVVGFAINSVVVGITNIVNLISLAADGISFFVSLLTGDFSGAMDAVKGMLRTLQGMFYSIFDLFGEGDWFNSFVAGAIDAFNKIFAGLSDVWNRVTAWLDSVSLFDSGSKLLSTLVAGVTASAGKLVDAVSGALGKVREYLPFSDAKRGPLSTLTASGKALIGTLGEGITANEGALLSPMQNALSLLGNKVLGSMPDLPMLKGGLELATNFIKEPNLPDFSNFSNTNENGRSRSNASERKSIAIHIAELVLPEVKEPQDFVTQMQNLVAEYEGA